MSWDRATPLPLFRDWLQAIGPGAGRSAVVVGCGLGVDAEFVAAHGFHTTAFDISPTAIGTAQQRYPDSSVDYRIADMLCLPREWQHAFDLVVEIINIQALPMSLRHQAIAAVANLVTEGGTLLTIENIRQDGDALPHRPRGRFSEPRSNLLPTTACTRSPLNALGTRRIRHDGEPSSSVPSLKHLR